MGILRKDCYNRLTCLICSFTVHPPRSEIWVFGMVDVSHTPALGYMQIVSKRDAATLLPIIQQHVARGTKIYSDQWAAYRQVSTLPNVASHHTVNHSVEFVNSVTGVHTENIESYWNRAKIKLKRMRGCHELELSGYLDEFMWRERHGRTTKEAFQNIILQIYSVPTTIIIHPLYQAYTTKHYSHVYVYILWLPRRRVEFQLPKEI